MKHSFVNSLTAIIMTVNMLAVLYVAFLAFYPFNVVGIEPQPYVLKSTTIQPGSYIFYTFHYCKHYDVQAQILHQLSGETVIRLENQAPLPDIDDATIRLGEGCGTTTKGVYIPKHTPEGRYVMTEHVEFQVNPFQKKHYEFVTEPFTVTK